MGRISKGQRIANLEASLDASGFDPGYTCGKCGGVVTYDNVEYTKAGYTPVCDRCSGVEQYRKDCAEMTPSTLCGKHQTQNCHCCDSVICGDNTSPLKEALKNSNEILETLKKEVSTLESGISTLGGITIRLGGKLIGVATEITTGDGQKHGAKECPYCHKKTLYGNGRGTMEYACTNCSWHSDGPTYEDIMAGRRQLIAKGLTKSSARHDMVERAEAQELLEKKKQ